MLIRVPTPDLQAAEAASVASGLRRSAVTLRRHAGRLAYHPQTGLRSDPDPELLAALAAIEQFVSGVQQGAHERSRDETVLAAGLAAERLRRAHAGVEEGAQGVVAALTVLRAVLTGSEDATMDAPYGSAAPRRHHPGALCTIVAERAEHLAGALEATAVLKANLERAR